MSGKSEGSLHEGPSSANLTNKTVDDYDNIKGASANLKGIRTVEEDEDEGCHASRDRQGKPFLLNLLKRI